MDGEHGLTGAGTILFLEMLALILMKIVPITWSFTWKMHWVMDIHQAAMIMKHSMLIINHLKLRKNMDSRNIPIFPVQNGLISSLLFISMPPICRMDVQLEIIPFIIEYGIQAVDG